MEKPSFEQRLAELAGQFRDGLGQRWDELDRLWRRLRSGMEDWGVLHRQLHSLAGSAGTFGWKALSARARELELQVAEVCGGADPDWSSLEVGMAELREAMVNTPPAAARSETGAQQWLASPMRVLVAEDDELARRVLVSHLERMGHRVEAVEDGAAALKRYEESAVDVMLLDVLMPGLDGLETARRVRSHEREGRGSRMPIIFLTADEDPGLLHEAIRAGGDDLLTKPCPPVVLDAKLHALQRTLGVSRELERYRREMEREMVLAERVMGVSLSANDPNFPGLHWKQRPAGRFSGDAVFYRRTGEVGYLLVADFTGHGLAAAVGTLIAGDVFHDLAQVACPGEILLRGLNDRLCHHLPVDFFAAACLVELQPGEMRIWNRGLPDVLWAVPGQAPQRIPSAFLPLGVVAEGYDVRAERFGVGRGGRLLIGTDGIHEARAVEGGEFGEEPLVRLVVEPDPLGTILAALDTHLAGASPRDDVTLVLLEPDHWAETTV